jgi:hypothetical protein
MNAFICSNHAVHVPHVACFLAVHQSICHIEYKKHYCQIIPVYFAVTPSICRGNTHLSNSHANICAIITPMYVLRYDLHAVQ